MIDVDRYIKEGLGVVKKLMRQGELSTAFQACQELLKVNPYDRTAQKYLKKIEERILEKNIEKVDADIDATLVLWKEKRFDELMGIYTRLFQYAPNYPRLRKLIEKLTNTLNETNKAERENFIYKATAAIKQLIGEKKYSDAIQATNELLAFDPLNETVRKCAAQAKDALIEEKLKENAHLLESADFDRALEFYESLLAIDPQHREAKRLALTTKARLAERKILAEKIHLNESIMRMKELFKSGEYEHVIQSCEEILRLDPKNITAKVFKKKALATIDSEIDYAAVKKMKETLPALLTEYQKNPAGFVVL